MSQEDRYKEFTEGGQPVIYLESAGKVRRNGRIKKYRNEWESIIFYAYYYCPTMDLALEKVIVKFSDNKPVIISRQDLYITFPMMGAGNGDTSTFEGEIYFRIDGIEAETYIKYDLEYVHFISTKDSPCQLDIKLEGFERDTTWVWAA